MGQNTLVTYTRMVQKWVKIHLSLTHGWFGSSECGREASHDVILAGAQHQRHDVARGGDRSGGAGAAVAAMSATKSAIEFSLRARHHRPVSAYNPVHYTGSMFLLTTKSIDCLAYMLSSINAFLPTANYILDLVYILGTITNS